jgi:hypothetical protein
VILSARPNPTVASGRSRPGTTSINDEGDPAMQPIPPATTPLDAEIGRYAAAGWNLVHRDQYTAVVASPGAAVNHVLHLILTLITCGFWSVVWILVTATSSSGQRLTLTAPPDGTVSATGPGGRQVDTGPKGFWKQAPGQAILILAGIDVVVGLLSVLNAANP